MFSLKPFDYSMGALPNLRPRGRLIFFFALVTTVSLAVFPSPAAAEPPYRIEDLVLQVFPDGFVNVEYSLKVDPTSPRVSIPLIGGAPQNILVVNQENIYLDFSLEADGRITVDTLGSPKINLVYDTPALTSKTGKIWLLDFSSPANSTIIFPEVASILSLNRIPNSIETLDGKIIIAVSEGRQKISYTINLPFATSPPDSAPASIRPAEELRPTPAAPFPPFSGYLSALLVLVIVGVGSAAGLFVYRRHLPKGLHRFPRKFRSVNVERLLRENPQLRPEDVEVVRFIAEAGGEALETEIRERFKLPKTTVWRMVKRLEREGILLIRKVGGQNAVKVSDAYVD